jgi:hypothetical protein
MKRKKQQLEILYLLLVFISLFLFQTNGISVEDHILFPLMDTTVFEESEFSNFGGYSYLIIGYLYEPEIYGFGGAPGNCETYLYFNIGSLAIPTIRSIILFLPGERGQIGIDFQIQVYKVTENWAEYGMTWDNKPTVNELITIVDTSNPRFDLTDEIKQDPFNTICLKGFQAHSNYFYSRSREGGNEEFQDLPHLIVNYIGINVSLLISLIISLVGLAIFLFYRISRNRR